MLIVRAYNESYRMKFREIEKIIKDDGWYRIKNNNGSHRNYHHNLKLKTINSILKQARINSYQYKGRTFYA